MQGCQSDVEVWQRILQVRTLVLSPDDDTAMWIKFANLCRKSERMLLAEKTINSLLSQERVCTSCRRAESPLTSLATFSTRKLLQTWFTLSSNTCGRQGPKRKA